MNYTTFLTDNEEDKKDQHEDDVMKIVGNEEFENMFVTLEIYVQLHYHLTSEERKLLAVARLKKEK